MLVPESYDQYQHYTSVAWELIQRRVETSLRFKWHPSVLETNLFVYSITSVTPPVFHAKRTRDGLAFSHKSSSVLQQKKSKIHAKKCCNYPYLHEDQGLAFRIKSVTAAWSAACNQAPHANTCRNTNCVKKGLHKREWVLVCISMSIVSLISSFF